MPAWRRVASYWQGAGLAWPPDGLSSQADCFGEDRQRNALCRVFLIDTPWSAVFVSWVMARAGVVPEAAFHDKANRALTFATEAGAIRIIRVRAFDVATFVAHGAAHVTLARTLMGTIK